MSYLLLLTFICLFDLDLLRTRNLQAVPKSRSAQEGGGTKPPKNADFLADYMPYGLAEEVKRVVASEYSENIVDASES